MIPKVRYNPQRPNKRNVACPFCHYTRYVQYRPRNYVVPFRCTNCDTEFTRALAEDAEKAMSNDLKV